jgi:pyruvate formate lyase activating enzyme
MPRLEADDGRAGRRGEGLGKAGVEGGAEGGGELAIGEGTPWHLARFHPDYRLLDAGPTHPELLARAVAIAEAEGLRHVYVERALGEERRATRCPGCGATVVRRDVWALLENRVGAGRCPDCGAAVAGRWTKERS